MKNISKEVQVRNLKLKNSLVMPPIATYQADEGGKVNDTLLSYYGERAKGGNIGLIITEHSYISVEGRAHKRQLSIASDDKIEGLKKLVDVIHQNGTKVFAQLNHAGNRTNPEATEGEVYSSSSIDYYGTVKKEVKEITKEDMKRIINDFVNAALRAQKAGYDGVEIHSAHGYLLGQFYTPLINKREDEYGGCLENRLRFHQEVIRAVRSAVGNDYPIALRLGASDYLEGGNTVEEGVKAAEILMKEDIDLIDISGGVLGYIVKGRSEAGYFSDVSKEIKKFSKIPVILTGGVKTLEEADKLIEDGACDMVGVGRKLFANPYWADDEFSNK